MEFTQYHLNTENHRDFKPRVILTSSGMYDHGPILGHLQRHLRDKRHTFLLTGFQSKGTNGYILSNLEECLKEEQKEIQKKIKLGKNKEGIEREIHCQEIQAEMIEMTGYSGHADQNGLLDYLLRDEDHWHYTTPHIFLNHGDNHTREEFKKKIEERSRELQERYKDDEEIQKKYQTHVIIPKKDSGWYDLDNNEWIGESTSIQELSQAMSHLSEEERLNVLNSLKKEKV